jgi:hypothetical protein
MRLWIESALRDLLFFPGVLLVLAMCRACDRPEVREIGARRGGPRASRSTEPVSATQRVQFINRSPATVSLDSEPKDSFYAKVVRVNNGEIELSVVVQPRETRFTLEGAPGGLVPGTYLKFSLTDGKARIPGRELKVRKITWVTEP